MVDAIEFQPLQALWIAVQTGGHGEGPAIPPVAAAQRFGNPQVGEPVGGIGKDPLVDQRGENRAGNGRIVPALGVEAGLAQPGPIGGVEPVLADELPAAGDRHRAVFCRCQRRLRCLLGNPAGGPAAGGRPRFAAGPQHLEFIEPDRHLGQLPGNQHPHMTRRHRLLQRDLLAAALAGVGAEDLGPLLAIQGNLDGIGLCAG